MPRKRQPKEIWQQTRERIWVRDQGRCQGPYCQEHPAWSLPLEAAHIDHIRSGKLGTNADSNLRVLCRRCHVLRADRRHQGMIANALCDGIIPPDWRRLVWDDIDLPPRRSRNAQPGELELAIILHYNNCHYLENYPLDREMIEAGVEPYPIELWNWGLRNRSGALRQHSVAVIDRNLLPREQASVTEFGILYRGLYYVCDHAKNQRWHEKHGSMDDGMSLYRTIRIRAK